MTTDHRTWVVELEPGVWLAPWGGDPGRTCVRENARIYNSHQSAATALRYARTHRAFARARITIHSKGESQDV